jgi:DNA transformation protein and related proteins
MARGVPKRDPELEAGIATALEIFADMGALTARKMFGGAGIYRDGLMFALIGDGDIYLKSDAINLGRYIASDCPPFVFHTKDGKMMEMSYRRMPERALDDTGEALAWGRMAFEAALRAAKK